MAKIAKQLTELIGNTPMLELTNYEKELGLQAKLMGRSTARRSSLNRPAGIPELDWLL